MNKKCIICGKEFGTKNNALTCSKECSYERKRKYNSKYQKDNLEKVAQWVRKYASNNQKKNNERKRQRYNRNKDKHKIRVNSKNYAKKLGLPTEGICPDCNKNKKLEIHHITYTLDDFILICKKCHLKRHNKILWIKQKKNLEMI